MIFFKLFINNKNLLPILIKIKSPSLFKNIIKIKISLGNLLSLILNKNNLLSPNIKVKLNSKPSSLIPQMYLLKKFLDLKKLEIFSQVPMIRNPKNQKQP
jgi:hypothetical protein